MTAFNEIKCEKILENIDEGIIYTTPTGTIKYINQMGQIITGYNSSYVLEKELNQILLLFDEYNEKQINNIISHFQQSTSSMEFEHDMYILTKDRDKKPVQVRVLGYLDENNEIKGIIIILADKTEERKYRQEIQKALRLNSLGKLSSGIAHDFNNVLTTILGNISLAKMDVQKETELFDLLQEAEDGIEKARAMTQQLLTFSREGDTEPEQLEIKKLLKETVDFTLSGSNVTCDYDLPDNLWQVIGDRGQISQALHNITINAVQAMPIGGNIYVSAENVILPKDNEYNLKNGEFIRLEIKDQGIGIPEEEIPFIFDPFYKSEITGEGMGLAVVHNIVQEHKGHIEIDSVIDQGTTVFIYLPAIRPVVEEETTEEVKKRKTSGKILIMDDEEVIRRVLSKMLKQLGYQPVAVPHGEDAIKAYNQSMNEGQPFEAVILDLTIRGGMGGLDTLQNLSKVDPNVNAVASSGYSTDKIITNFSEYGFSGKLVKPYKVNELEELLKEIL